ncbi:MAG: hypothetical protein ABT940_03670 [Alphaproteobacteria bacterium]
MVYMKDSVTGKRLKQQGDQPMTLWLSDSMVAKQRVWKEMVERVTKAELARVRRAVRNLRSRNPFPGIATIGYDTACDDILNALKKAK